MAVLAGVLSSALASHGQAMFFDSPHDLLSPATRPKALAQLRFLGVKALRVELHWHDVAPAAGSAKRPSFDATDPAAYEWGQYDALMAEAQRLKWRVLLTVTSPIPKWASAAHTPIYLTEFGIQGKPNLLGVSAARQVEYDAISEKLAWENPRVAAFSQYLLSDESSHGRFSGFRTGLETPTGAFKPLYRGFPLPLVVSRRHGGLSLWGFVRPAGGPTKVRVLVEPRGSRRYRTLRVVQTDRLGYWTLKSTVAGRRWRVSWRSPAGVLYMGPPISAS